MSAPAQAKKKLIRVKKLTEPDEEKTDRQYCIEMNKQRSECFEKNKQWLFDASRVKGKGSKLRKNFFSFLQFGTIKIYDTSDDDYEYCNKFGRGFWSEHIVKSFTKEQQRIIIDEIAKQYGAFSY